MTILKVPLSESEKQLLRKTFRIRVVLGILFVVPLLGGVGLFTYFTIVLPVLNEHERVSFVPVLIVLIILFFLFFNYVVPFYRNSYRNLFATEKLVIETKVLNVTRKLRSKGVEYIVETDYGRINSWGVAILKSSVFFSEMTAGMHIKIHCLNKNKLDILDITRC